VEKKTVYIKILKNFKEKVYIKVYIKFKIYLKHLDHLI